MFFGQYEYHQKSRKEVLGVELSEAVLVSCSEDFPINAIMLRVGVKKEEAITMRVKVSRG